MSDRILALQELVLQLAEGDLDARLPIEGTDELSALTLSIHLLAEELSAERTRRQKAEDELRRTAETLARSNTELAAFAYAASHDLQEPLRKITAFGSRLADADGLEDRERDYLDRMLAASDRMSALIDALLRLSRIGSTTSACQEQPLSQALETVLDDLSMRIQESGGQVVLDSDGPVFARPIQLRQLLQNLVQNALKFRHPERPPVVHVGVVPHDAGALVTVSDNGIGFEPRFAEQILRPFERLHGMSSPYTGTGIGLALCTRICSRHGGWLRAEGRVGEGATFRAWFPTT